MRVLVTGADGVIGERLLRFLLEEPALSIEGERPEKIDEIILACRSGDSLRYTVDPRLTIKSGNIGDRSFLKRLFDKRVDSVFHLASTPSVEIEEHFETGFPGNFHSTCDMLELCRQQNNRPRVIFASSIAVFGGPLPHKIDDNHSRTPQNSYGTAKAIGELLIDDYTRNGFIDGRSLRLPFVISRPTAQPNSIPDRIGAILREPLLGRNVVCPFRPETSVPVASVRNAARSLLRMHQVPSDRFGHTRALNMPALTIVMSELADAVAQVNYPGIRGTVMWAPEEGLQDIVDCWPSAIQADEAQRHGLRAENNASEILANFIEDYNPLEPQGKPLLAVV
ncbi:MAG: NAD-dependent epimerase/dehydratase family protein [Hyphomicrobiales bacterium]|nr:NAD-dependent epimerase/dehydratase family protein [Hyphomicrobiales bacterium]